MIRTPLPEDHAPLAWLWHEGWHDAHAAHVPAALTATRIPDVFRDRLAGMLPRCRVAGPTGAPAGFCEIEDGSIGNIYIARAARGSGVAQALLSEAEARLRAAGHGEATLTCLAANARARRFYERQGWIEAGPLEEVIDLPGGPFRLSTVAYRKTLAVAPGAQRGRPQESSRGPGTVTKR